MEWRIYNISGKVQGVSYRKSISQAMMKKGFEGYVKNLTNGDVELAVWLSDTETEALEVESIIEQGSPLSEVESYSYEVVEDIELPSNGFTITY